jgi:hypothetical protein
VAGRRWFITRYASRTDREIKKGCVDEMCSWKWQRSNALCWTCMFTLITSPSHPSLFGHYSCHLISILAQITLSRILATDVHNLISLSCPNLPQQSVQIKLDTIGKVGWGPKRAVEVSGCGGRVRWMKSEDRSIL